MIKQQSSEDDHVKKGQILRKSKNCGDNEDWTRDIVHAKHTLYHWAMSPSFDALEGD